MPNSEFGGNFNHLKSRISQRINERDRTIFAKRAQSLTNKMKTRSMPNTIWFTKVSNGSQVIGYLVGQGNYISSVLSAGQRPYGVEI